ncbi:unnamed protein product [Owenia fusiformis]|uniref:Carboxylic ester hydrolase n=1 Tax=Owenia fusiformis TaxID=6347 RepID=A0A8J1Y0H0_OWEFU|nr:unnamed protein product [Owenia fusiformis]
MLQCLGITLFVFLYPILLLGTKVVHADREYVTRNTDHGQVRGFTRHVHGERRAETFLGIPYAAPPVGSLRFEYPEDNEPWTETLDATTLPPACPQMYGYMGYIKLHVPDFNNTNEDCLYLNVYTPHHRSSSRRIKRAVLVFIHGGSQEFGMGAHFPGHILAVNQDIVVVTFNYRIGPLGFLSFATNELPGNYGLLDQVKLLQWVQKNIGEFGGDAERVTILGHSAGGASVGLHLVSPLSTGLFKRVISMSGTPFAHWAAMRPPASPEKYARSYAKSMDCASGSIADIKFCLKMHGIETLMNGNLSRATATTERSYAVVDGYFLHGSPEEMIDQTRNAEEYLLGTTKDEKSLLVKYISLTYNLSSDGLTQEEFQQQVNLQRSRLPILPESHGCGLLEMLRHYYTHWEEPDNKYLTRQSLIELLSDKDFGAPAIKTANILSGYNMSTYMYIFEYRSELDTTLEWEGVPHGVDLFYLFGIPLEGHPTRNYTDQDKQMSHHTMTFFGNFIKNGQPRVKSYGGPIYNKQSAEYAAIGRGNTVETVTGAKLRPGKIDLWNNLLPKMLQSKVRNSPPTQCSTKCNETETALPEPDTLNAPRETCKEGVPFRILTWVFIGISCFLLIILIAFVSRTCSCNNKGENKRPVKV